MPLDEATTELIDQMAEAGAPPLHELAPAEAREMAGAMTEMLGPGPDVARSEDHTVTSSDGVEFGVTLLVPDVPVRGVLVFYHGGGWVIGSAADYDHLCRIMANRTGCAVVNVDYRLAPENPYPAAVDDCYAALEWAAANIDSVAGADVPLMVCGDSAGANLAAAVTLRARDRNGPRIAWQGLIYPVADSGLDTASYTAEENQLMLNREGMEWFWDLYCPDVSRRAEPEASPLRADLSGLPPAHVQTAEYDVLRDEGEAYAAKLKAAGVPVELSRQAGQMHGYFALLMLPGSARAMDEFVEAVDAAL
ncbi:MAG: alpha/beta hydrolase [Acidimicrobiales bacterium]